MAVRAKWLKKTGQVFFLHVGPLFTRFNASGPPVGQSTGPQGGAKMPTCDESAHDGRDYYTVSCSTLYAPQSNRKYTTTSFFSARVHRTAEAHLMSKLHYRERAKPADAQLSLLDPHSSQAELKLGMYSGTSDRRPKYILRVRVGGDRGKRHHQQ